MPVYTVHEPPPSKTGQASPNPERFVFLRDGFSFWAFVLAPLWMLRHRLWLVFFVFIVAMAALLCGLIWHDASGTMKFAIFTLVSLLVGLEASSLRRLTLGRRGWRNVGVVVADDVESAEHRFFDSWSRREPMRTAAVLPTVSNLHLPPASPHVIGLFPEPGAPR